MVNFCRLAGRLLVVYQVILSEFTCIFLSQYLLAMDCEFTIATATDSKVALWQIASREQVHLFFLKIYFDDTYISSFMLIFPDIFN